MRKLSTTQNMRACGRRSRDCADMRMRMRLLRLQSKNPGPVLLHPLTSSTYRPVGKERSPHSASPQSLGKLPLLLPLQFPRRGTSQDNPCPSHLKEPCNRVTKQPVSKPCSVRDRGRPGIQGPVSGRGTSPETRGRLAPKLPSHDNLLALGSGVMAEILPSLQEETILQEWW